MGENELDGFDAVYQEVAIANYYAELEREREKLKNVDWNKYRSEESSDEND